MIGSAIDGASYERPGATAMSFAGDLSIAILPKGDYLVNARVLSDVHSRVGVDVAEVLCARSIKPFEGGRWRLRRTRADGRP
ncbi:MAG TPA: hypothetical protein VEJ47_08095, partial [Candidatus Eremiobacteraceae bacterium]|nr:hypothetical protein [Candidatus Eremiobacteraceae bacterium]